MLSPRTMDEEFKSDEIRLSKRDSSSGYSDNTQLQKVMPSSDEEISVDLLDDMENISDPLMIKRMHI